MKIATIRRLMIVAATIAGLITASEPVQAQTPATAQVAAVATTDPTLRPNTPMPTYPPQSRKNKEAGVVRMTLCIEADGHVSKADLAETSGFPNLDNAVLKWVKGVQFNPALNGATPIALCDFVMKYEFQVTKGPTRQQQTTNPFDIGPPSGMANGP